MPARSSSAYDGIYYAWLPHTLTLTLIRGSSYACTLAPDEFSLLSLCPDGQRRIYIG
jgi:hypothetical protein